MTPNEQSALIRLAREAGCSETWGADSFRFTIEELQRFAELVRNQTLNEVGCALIDNQFVGCHKAVEILRELKS